MKQEYMSVKDIADELNGLRTTRAITRWIREGLLPASRPGGSGPWMIKRADFEQFMRDSSNDPPSEEDEDDQQQRASA